MGGTQIAGHKHKKVVLRQMSPFNLCVALSTVAFAVLLALLLRWLFTHPSADTSPVEFPSSGYFGSGEPKPDDPSVVPFRVNVSDEQMAELRSRLQNARIGHKQLEDVGSFEFGFALKELLKWRDYWLNEFDWPKAERELNRWEHFRTQIEGLHIHFIHARPPNPSAYSRVVPILLAHGWPGSVFEFHKLIPLLVDPRSAGLQSDIAFEVVAPSNPGFGWSEQAHKRGMNAVATARIFHKLMVERLDLSEYMAQGGDWGSLIVSNMGRMFPESVLGVHVNIVFTPNFGSVRCFLRSLVGMFAPQLVFADPEQYRNFSLFDVYWILEEGGYFHIQATKPDTVGVALNDSPIGLLAYVLEKFSTWTNRAFLSLPDGGLLKKYTRDELLTNVCIYWFNANILASQRYYKEAFSMQVADRVSSRYVRVPSAYAAFPHELGGVKPRELVQESYNLVQMNVYQDGGHFAALEMPTEMGGDIIQFAKKLL